MKREQVEEAEDETQSVPVNSLCIVTAYTYEYISYDKQAQCVDTKQGDITKGQPCK